MIHDKLLQDKFFDIHNKAINNELDHWQETLEGRLALIIILDQFSRNIYRDKGEAFQTDVKALKLAKAQKLDDTLNQIEIVEGKKLNFDTIKIVSNFSVFFKILAKNVQISDNSFSTSCTKSLKISLILLKSSFKSKMFFMINEI